MKTRGGSHSIGPLHAQQLLALAGLRVAPALTAGAIVGTHTMRVGDGILVAAAMLVAARLLDPGRELARLMPLANLINSVLMPVAGLALAWIICLPLKPLALADLPPALLGSLLVLALGIWSVHRFERRVEARVALVGAPALARSLARELEANGISRYRVVGWIDAGSPDLVADARRLGGLADVGEIVAREQIDLIVNAAGDGPASANGNRTVLSALDVVEQVAGACLGQRVRLIGLNQLHEEVFGHVPLATLDAAFFQFLMHPRFRGGSNVAKRVLDLVVGGLAAIVLAPVLAVAAIAIKLGDGGPVLFRQRRVGAGGEEFEIVKLRTMRVDAGNGAAWSSADDDRVTRVGRILRRTHLDEVPQLWNVLRDEMSLVGPRPEQPAIVSELEWQIPFYDRRELVKPGITGWAQIRCGYAGSEEGTAWKLCHDLYYLKHRSAALDAMILLQTLVTAVHDVQFAVRPPDENFVLDAVRAGADA